MIIAKRQTLLTLLGLGLSLASIPAHAQLRQYVSPSELALIELERQESLESAMRDAPWEVRRLKIQPRISLGDLQRIDNVFDTGDESERVTDVRATASAGIDAYLQVGENTILSAFVRPSYSWWKDNEQLRRFNQSYGAAAFGFMDRLSTRLTLKRSESERLVNSELRIPATIRQDQIALEAALRLGGPWQVFGSASYRETSYPNAEDLAEQAPNLARLGRNEDTAGFGVAYDIPNRLNLGLGWRRVESDFQDDPDGRSNRGSFPFVKIAVPGNRVQIAAEVGLRKLDFANEENLASRDEVLGTVQTVWPIGHRTRFSAYGARDLVYSAVDTGGFFNSSRLGAALSRRSSRRLNVQLFAESGRDEFESAGDSLPGRVDDFRAVGVTFRLPVRKRLVVQLGYVDTQVDSNFDDFDRSYRVLRSLVSLDLPDFPF